MSVGKEKSAMDKKAQMKRAWEIARKAAHRFGGTASDYMYGDEGAIVQAAAEAKGAAPIETEWKPEYITVPEDDLPIISYQTRLKGTDIAGPGADGQGNYSFWLLNHGKGRSSDDDDLDMSVYTEWENGFDFTVEDIIERFMFLVKEKHPTAKYEDGEIVYDKYEGK